MIDVIKNTSNPSHKEKVIGVIRGQQLKGLYHTLEYCPHLLRELEEHGGEIKQLNRKVSLKHPCFCRHCIYLEAEKRDINCFTICPQKKCVEQNTIPEEMKKEILQEE